MPRVCFAERQAFLIDSSSCAPVSVDLLLRVLVAGRAGRKGLAISLLGGPEDMVHMKAIEEHWLHPIEKLNCSDKDALRDTFEAFEPKSVVKEAGGK